MRLIYINYAMTQISYNLAQYGSPTKSDTLTCLWAKCKKKNHPATTNPWHSELKTNRVLFSELRNSERERERESLNFVVVFFDGVRTGSTWESREEESRRR